MCYKTYFFVKIFGGYQKKQYLCTVFFMVLDLRLSKDWVVGMTILLFLYIFLPLTSNLSPLTSKKFAHVHFFIPSRTPYPRSYTKKM